MAPATITYTKAGTKPPVFLAGDFSAWECIEMDYKVEEGQEEYQFYKTIEAEAGSESQYKFRIGESDWWVLNETAPVVTDNIGNRNNLLTMPSKPESASDHAAEASQQSPDAEQTEESTKEESQLKGNETEEQTGTNLAEVSHEMGEVEKAPESSKEGQENENEEQNGTIVAEVSNETSEVEEASDSSKEGQENTSAPQLAVQPQAEDEQVPTLRVEKLDDSPSFGEDFGASATFAEKDAFAMRSQDAEPDITVVHPEETEPAENKISAEVSGTAAEVGESVAILDRDATTPEIPDTEAGNIGLRRLSLTPIPQVADTAAEVADSAAALDREESGTPELTEEEAGKVGRRRMSLTPISQVADTAAEVAAVAALLDKDSLYIERLPGYAPFDEDDGKEYPITPEDERAPLFSHEKFIPSSHASPPKSSGSGSPAINPWADRTPFSPVERYIDPGSNSSPRREDLFPTPEAEHRRSLPFPTTREGIMAQLEQIQRSLPEDEVRLTSPCSPTSPAQQFGRSDVLSPSDSPQSERRNGPSHEHRAMSLQSIVEENDSFAAKVAEAPKDQTAQLKQDNGNLEADQYAQISNIIEHDAEPKPIAESSKSTDPSAVVETAEEDGQVASHLDQDSAQAVDSAASEATEEILAEENALPDQVVPLGVPLGSPEQELDKAPAEVEDPFVSENVQNEPVDESMELEQAVPSSEVIGNGDEVISDDSPKTTPPTSSEGGPAYFPGHPAPVEVNETAVPQELVREDETHNTESSSAVVEEAPAIVIQPATMPKDQPSTVSKAAIEEEVREETHAPEPKSTPVPDEVKTHIHTQQEDTVTTETETPEPTSKTQPDEVKTHIHTEQEDTVATSRAISRDTASTEFSEPATTLVESTVTKRKVGKPSTTEQPESVAAMDGASSVRDNEEEHPGLFRMICSAVMGWFGGFFAKLCGGDREGNKKAKRVIGASAAVILFVVAVNAVWSSWG